jgi:excisionase family DNA binding protein
MMIEVDRNVEMPRFISVRDFRDITGLGATRVYQLINDGELRRVKLGKKTVFVESEVKDWLNLKIKQSPPLSREPE